MSRTARLTFVTPLLLAACGGGGGGSDPSPADARTDPAEDATGGDPDGASPPEADGSPSPDAAAPVPDAAVGPGVEAFSLGTHRVEIARDGRFSVFRDGADAPLLTSAASGPVIETGQGEPTVVERFGAWRVGLDALTWTAPAGDPTITGDPGQVRLFWPNGAGLRFSAHASGGLLVELVTPEAEGPPAGTLRLACAADEGFFGLGTQVVGLDLRGRTYPLWTQEQGIGKPENGAGFPLSHDPEAAYAPMGVWHSSAGFSALIGHDAYSELDLCEASADAWRLRSFGAAPSFLILPGTTLPERLRALTEVIGRPSMPPAWAFAPWNDAVGGPTRLAEVADRLRAEGIPSSAIWSEDWIGGEQTDNGFRLSYAWAWDPARYPDLPADIERLHARGFAFLAYFNPFVPDTTRMWDEGLAGGFLVENAAGEVASFVDPGFRNTGLVDLSNPEAVTWLEGYLRTAIADLGIDGWMVDFAEWLPWNAVLHSGEAGYLAHNRYPLDWQRVNRRVMSEARPDDSPGWLYFARSGWASLNGGTAGIAPSLWAGDQNTDWDRDDGLPTVIPIGVHAGLSGVAMYGSDIAGYTSVLNANTTKELFFRWASLGAFTPLMRTHHGSDECGNWSFDRDADTLAHYRRYAVVHTLLYPYLRALLTTATETGLPAVRHPALAAPEVPALWREGRDVYFLGDALYVAPVVERAAAGRTVHLPGAGWWPLFGAAPRPDGGAVEIPAGPTEIPVFVRPGTVLPLLPSAPDSFYPATEPGVTTLADVEDKRRLALYPDAAGAVLGEYPGLQVVGGGLTPDAPPDWSAATVDGLPLPPCAEATPDAHCRLDDGVVLRGIGGEVAFEGAHVTVVGERPGEWQLMWAGAAFGAWAEPTAVGDIEAVVPPPCEAVE